MDQKNMVKCLILTDAEMYTIPGLAIVGAATIVSAFGYGVYKLVTKKINTKKEQTNSVE